MKKLLLASVAVSGLAFAAPAAHADIDLEVGGYFKGYGVFLDTDTANAKDFDFIRDTEVHVSGATTLDNGLTVGFHTEFDVDGADSAAALDESYLYFSGDWGRVNFGEEDGASYLLQVAAPSADSNIDGIRNYVAASSLSAVDYDADITGKTTKLTYLSPIFSGFQAGVSFAPDASGASADKSIGTEGTTADMSYEVAARYEGQFNNVGVIAGAGYSTVTNDAAGDDADSINVGLDLDVAAFGLGVVYLTETDTADVDTDTLVIGADYTTGPFKLGASYLNQDVDGGTDTDRYTGGVTYEYGPGMSFRGSLSYTEEDTSDVDETALILGTQVKF